MSTQNILSHTWMTFSNGGISLSIVEQDGVLGIEAQHQQYGTPSVKSFIPIGYSKRGYDHHFEFQELDYAQPLFLMNWLATELSFINDWFKNNNDSDLNDYVIYRKLKENNDK